LRPGGEGDEGVQTRVNDALLVIDVINDFEHEDGDRLLEAFRDRLPSMVDTIASARSRSIPVIYVNDTRGRWDGDAPAHVRDAIEQGRGGDVVSSLSPEPGDRFVFKPRYSAFDETPLGFILREQSIERVLLAGAATEGCVVQSGIDARELGFKATILTAACATVDPDLERLALAYAERVAGIHIA
jgi:nicotinamidase-related amidase